MEGQHQLDVSVADGLVEQLVDGGLPLQLAAPVLAHESTLCGQGRSESQDTVRARPLPPAPWLAAAAWWHDGRMSRVTRDLTISLLEPTEVRGTRLVTHVRYRVTR